MMYENICYERPFLKEVVARIDFVAPLEAVQHALDARFLKAITKRFPISEPAETIAQELQFGPGEFRSKETRSKEWNFYGKQREKQLSIAQNCLFAVYRKYSNYENAKKDFVAAVEAFSKAYPDAQVARFGLRYINMIEIPNIDPVSGWASFINSDLLAGHSLIPREEVVRLFHIIESMRGDLRVRFQYGIPNSDYPAILKQSQFIIDIDAYIQISHAPGESVAYMDLAHTHIQDLFEKSITADLREQMHVRPTES